MFESGLVCFNTIILYIITVPDIILEISKKVGGIMKFQRINEDTVRCIVYKQDMQEFGIGLEDFFKNKGKVHEFLHEVVERAEQEVGYIPKEGMLSMQIIPINSNMISITFTENGNEGFEDILNNLKDTIAAGIEDVISDEEYSEEDLEDNDDLEEQSLGYDKTVSGSLRKKNEMKHGMEKAQTIAIAMTSVEKMAAMCKMLDINKTVSSSLYYLKNKDIYCMIIEKNRLSEMDMRHILILAVEYTSNITDDVGVISHIREYGETIIEKGAYRILKKYY